MIGVDANGTMNELHQIFFIEHGIALNKNGDRQEYPTVTEANILL